MFGNLLPLCGRGRNNISSSSVLVCVGFRPQICSLPPSSHQYTVAQCQTLSHSWALTLNIPAAGACAPLCCSVSKCHSTSGKRPLVRWLKTSLCPSSEGRGLSVLRDLWGTDCDIRACFSGSHMETLKLNIIWSTVRCVHVLPDCTAAAVAE